MPDKHDIFNRIERLNAVMRAKADAAAAQFRSELQRLIGSIEDPALLQSRIDRLGAEFGDKLRLLGEHVRAEIEQLLPPPPPPTAKRRFYEEPRRRAHPINRRRPPKWPPGRRPSAGGVTVEPDRPNGLSGGAAAPLEFD